jgi:hypothetical protein
MSGRLPPRFAKIAGKEAPADAFPDSQDISAALLGESQTGRDHVVEHANGLADRLEAIRRSPAAR